MKKTASVLAFLLAIGLLAGYCVMVRDDGKNAAANIQRGFRDMGTPEFKEDMDEIDARHGEERIYGFGGLVAIIVGFALWPYGGAPATLDREDVKCPSCAETIKRAAIKCRFCGLERNPVGGKG